MKRMTEKEDEEEEEVLQTKIVSAKEVIAEWEKWIPSATNEVDSLIIEKAALKPLEPDIVQQMIQEEERNGVKIEVIPSKVVYSKKPGKKGGKRKVRWVVCGNFESRSPDEENYSSGADATAFRVLCRLSAQRQWVGYIYGGCQNCLSQRRHGHL